MVLKQLNKQNLKLKKGEQDVDRETKRNLAKFGPLEKKPKKKLTMKERQPIPGGLRSILSEAQPLKMFRTQKRKTRVKGTMEGKPVNTTGGMFKAMANADKAKQAAKMDTSVYKPTNMTKSPYGDADLAGKGRRGTPKGNYGNVRQITEDTKYGGMQKTKESKLKSPAKVTPPKQEESKKRFRAGPTMTSMGGMRKSGTLRGRNVK